MDEAALIHAARGGDVTAFNRLVLAHQDAVYGLCLRMLGQREAAEDATQDAFISAYRHIRDHRGGSLRSWMLRIASNSCLDQLRARKRRPTEPIDFGDSPIDPADPDPSPERQSLTRELGHALADAISQLPPDQRLALVLCDVQGLPYEEIATVTGANLGTVKSRINRARAALRMLVRTNHAELLPERYRLV